MIEFENWNSIPQSYESLALSLLTRKPPSIELKKVCTGVLRKSLTITFADNSSSVAGDDVVTSAYNFEVDTSDYCASKRGSRSTCTEPSLIKEEFLLPADLKDMKLAL